jgi:hypothetical protein
MLISAGGWRRIRGVPMETGKDGAPRDVSAAKMPDPEHAPAAQVVPPVEPHHKSLTVALVPQPRQLPPPAFDKDDLQRVFAEIIRSNPYRSFEFIYEDRGIQLNNGPEDTVEIRPALFQVQAKMDGPDVLTADAAESKVTRILKVAGAQLKVDAFIQCAIQIHASVDAPKDDARTFVAETLLHDTEQALARELGPGYFAGGVRFRRPKEDGTGEDSLSIEPFVQPPMVVLLTHQIARIAAGGPIEFDQASSWIGEGFDFLAGPTMRLLSK